MSFPLPPDVAGLLRREPYHEPALTGRGAFNRAVLIGAGAVLGAGVLAEMPTRPFFRPHPKSLASVLVSVGLAGLAGAYYLYRVAWRPWRDGPPGYRLVGEFTVREKNHLFSRHWVRLEPGANFQVAVAPALYEQLQAGDAVQVIYTAGGELVSVTRWGGAAGN